MELGEKELSVNRLLFEPMFLLSDLIGEWVPGVLFIILLLAKGEPHARAIFATGLVGYKTKLFAIGVIALIIGKMLAYVGLVFVRLAKKTVKAPIRQEPSSTSSPFQRLDPKLQTLVISAISLPLMYGKSSAIELLTLWRTGATFYLSSGSALLLAACIPPSDNLRVVEFIVGLVFVGNGIEQLRNVEEKLTAAMLGMSLGRAIGGLPKEQLERLIPLINILSPFFAPAASNKTEIKRDSETSDETPKAGTTGG